MLAARSLRRSTSTSWSPTPSCTAPRRSLAYRKWTRGERELRDSLEALMLFRLRQPLPMLLALLRDLDSKALRPKMVLRGLRIIENFHFIYTAVASQPSSGGVSGMYARSARELLAASTPQAKTKVLTELETKLEQRLPSYAEFEASFLELRSSRVYTQQTPLVRYVLRRLHVAACARGVNPEELDLDAADDRAPGAPGTAPPTVPHGDVARLGNLLLITSDLNEALADKSFATKQQILRADRANVDAEILNASQWGSTEIVKRTKKLAERAYEQVWSF